MSSKHFLTHEEVIRLVLDVGTKHIGAYDVKCYPIPRGGIPAAYALAAHPHLKIRIVDDPEEADFFMDDIIDSGATATRYEKQYGKPVHALINKQHSFLYKDVWVIFPWEQTEINSADDIPMRLLQFIGEDVARGGLKETPQRFLKAWKFWTSGYGQDPESIMKVFEDGGERYDEMVIVKDIPFYSHCEHHLAPIFGTASIAYIPNGRIVGLSKLSRLLDIYARRLQVQERITNQVADAIEKYLEPLGVGVIIKARHLCMESRGISKQGHYTITSSLRGVLREKPEARSEFMSLTK